MCFNCSPSTKLATDAVTRLLAHSRRPWATSNLPSGTQPIIMAANDARKPTTMAWHCTQHIKSTAYAYHIEFILTLGAMKMSSHMTTYDSIHAIKVYNL